MSLPRWRKQKQSNAGFAGSIFVPVSEANIVLCFAQRENGYIIHPIPTPISTNNKKDQPMYFARSRMGRRLKNPNATETISANRIIA